jgi:hypothetical protein
MDVSRWNHARVVAALVASVMAGAAVAVNASRRREATLVQECQERAYDAVAVVRMREAYEQWKRDPSVGRPYSELRPALIAEGRLEERSHEPSL